MTALLALASAVLIGGAGFVLRERLSRLQYAGVAGALLAVALVSSGA